jgi:hypothetical protein
MTETLMDVSPPSKKAEPQPSAEELEAAPELYGKHVPGAWR